MPRPSRSILRPVAEASIGESVSALPSTTVAHDGACVRGAPSIGRPTDGAVIPRKAARRPPRTTLLAGIVLAVAFAIGTTACSMGGCPTALASGVLEAQGDELVLRAETGEVMRIDWPNGYVVETDADGALVLARFLGDVVAHQGEIVNVGGGMSADNTTFQGCGELWVGEGPPPA